MSVFMIGLLSFNDHCAVKLHAGDGGREDAVTPRQLGLLAFGLPADNGGLLRHAQSDSKRAGGGIGVHCR